VADKSKEISQMDKAKAAALKNCENALACSITYLPTADANHALVIQDKLIAADAEIKKYELENTPEYKDAVLRADAMARQFRSRLEV
jgi:hypothetical protein